MTTYGLGIYEDFYIYDFINCSSLCLAEPAVRPAGSPPLQMTALVSFFNFIFMFLQSSEVDTWFLLNLELSLFLLFKKDPR